MVVVLVKLFCQVNVDTNKCAKHQNKPDDKLSKELLITLLTSQNFISWGEGGIFSLCVMSFSDYFSLRLKCNYLFYEGASI